MDSGLPNLPETGNVEGTRFEIQAVERQFNCKWKNDDRMGGLTERHRSSVLRYMVRMSAYALAVGMTKEDLNYIMKLGIDSHEAEHRIRTAFPNHDA